MTTKNFNNLDAKILTRQELKKVFGGLADARTVYVCGWRYSENKCYCDWCYQDTHTAKLCDDPCNSFFCGH